MSLPIIDSNANFSCGACSRCCTQPWAILIEKEKILAIEHHGFASYQQLAGKEWFQTSKDVSDRYLVIPKQKGTTRCLFLGEDGLCIIHKELGARAKPIACQKFPYHVSHTPTDDRVSLNFGCPGVQEDHGAPLVDQREGIAATCEVIENRPTAPTMVPLMAQVVISRHKYDALMETLEVVFSQNVSMWSGFVHALSIVRQLAERIQLGDEDARAWLESERQFQPQDVEPFASPVDAPRASRMLFAGTMLRDVVPANVTLNMSLWGRITLLPRLMTLVKLSGSYDSKLLKRRVDVDRVVQHTMNGMVPSADALLRRYLRTRIWQRFLVGNRLSVVAGIHQHILDLNAVVFLARAMAEAKGTNVYSEALVAEALSLVEMNIANQARVFEHPSLSFFTSMIDSLPFAHDSLKMMAQGTTTQATFPALSVGSITSDSLVGSGA